LPKVFNAKCVLLVFYAYTHPNVSRPLNLSVQIKQSLRPFREHLKRMPGGAAHHIKDVLDEFQGHLYVEKVAH
jgi:hypothetical protein